MLRSLCFETFENRQLLAGDFYPHVIAFERLDPVNPTTTQSQVTFSLRFSENVTGVDSTDLHAASDSTASFDRIEVSGTGSNYQVTVSGVSGTGLLKLQLVDNSTIRDSTNHGLVTLDAFEGFQELGPHRTVDYPSQSAWADFNGDSIPDAVITGLQRTQIFLGRSDGTLDLQTTTSNTLNLGSGIHIATADFNHDQWMDYVVIGQDQTAGVASVYLGKGNGQFQPVMDSPTGQYPKSLAVDDVNQDGNADLVMVRGSQGTIDVMLGQGTGRFLAPTSVYSATQPNALALVELNGDGKLDMVVADYDHIVLLMGNGAGGFTRTGIALATIYPTALSTGDINADGLVDILAVDMQATQLSVFLNLGNGNTSRTMFSASAESVQLIDANGDSHLDLVTCNSNAGVTLFLGYGNGQFAPGRSLLVGNSNRALRALDVNQDGKLDLSLLNYTSGTIETLVNLERGDFESQAYTLLPRPEILMSAASSTVPESGVNQSGKLRVSLVLTMSAMSDTSVNYELISDSATAGADFVAASGTTHFAPGEIIQFIDIEILNDHVAEATESFRIHLFAPQGATVRGNDSLILTITDDDAVGTLTLVVHGFQCSRDIPGWAEAIGQSISEQLNKYSQHNETRYVGWDSGFSTEDNEKATTEIANRVVAFFNDTANSDIRDLLLVGHSRGGIFVTKVAEKISSTLSSRLNYVQQILLDPTAAVPMGDKFPTALASIVDRTIDYHDNHTLVNDALELNAWLSSARTLVNFFGKTFPNDWLVNYFTWLSQYMSLTLDSDLRPTEISYTIGESVNVHNRMLDWKSALLESESGVFPDDIEQRVKNLGHDLSYLGEVVDLARKIESLMPGWLPGKYRMPIAINRILHSSLMHTNIHDWWRENQLVTDMENFVLAKTGWTTIADHSLTSTPTHEHIETWNAYYDLIRTCVSTEFNFPLLTLLTDPSALISQGLGILVDAGASLLPVAEAGFDLALQVGKSQVESFQIIAQGLYEEATQNILRLTETLLQTAQQRSISTRDGLLLTASALESLGAPALPVANALRLIASYSPGNIAVSVENDRLILTTSLASELGQVTLKGFLDANGIFDLTGRISAPSFGRFAFANVDFDWSNRGVSVSGVLNLPTGLGGIVLSGMVQTTGKVEMQGLGSLALKGFVFQQMTFNLKSSGLTLFGSSSLPVLGSASFLGQLYPNGQFRLMANVRNKSLAEMPFPELSLNLSNSGLRLTGNASLPIFLGSVLLSGTMTTSGAFNLSADLRLTKAGVSLRSVTLSNSGATVIASAPLLGSLRLGLHRSGSTWILEANIKKTVGLFSVTTIQIRGDGSFNVKVSQKLLGSIWVQGGNIANLKSSLDSRLSKLTPSLPKIGGFKEPSKLAKTHRSLAKVFNGLTTGAIVFFDSNRNLQLDAAEDDSYSEPWTFTSSNGEFLPAVPIDFDTNNNGQLDDAEGQWVVLDGTYSATNLPAESLRIAPASWSAITPISTLVTLLSQTHNMTIDQAMTRTIHNLNLPELDLSGFDVFAELTLGNQLALPIYQAESALTNINRQLVSLFKNSDNWSPAQLSHKVCQLIADSLANTPSPISLTDESLLRNWLVELRASTSSALTNEDLNAAAEVVISLNREMADRMLGQSYGAVQAVEAVKALAQGEVATSLEMFATGQLSRAQFRELFTGLSLKNKIDGQLIRATLLAPDTLEIEATSPSGANVDIPVSAYDLLGRPLPVTLSHASGIQLPLGITTVVASIADLDGTPIQRPITVSVVDTIAPTLTIPNILVEATSVDGASVTFPLDIAHDNVDLHPTLIFNMPSGVFPIGETVVELLARDSSGNETVGELVVRVWERRPLAWQNEHNKYDVSGDGIVSPLDALLLINHLNNPGSHALGPEGPSSAEEWFDVSSDDRISPIDALLVINQLNHSAGESESRLAMQSLELQSPELQTSESAIDELMAYWPECSVSIELKKK